ncbi:hypothetical protein GWK47_014207 [Chionoecetes opilio]|uniref:Uncharacterized protein n=1 Tax=Chionoecetes opilio TaxID=41210 RepID=A0A8J4XYF9_CHIOP|nr:hypothetical protein GWK47_014207 [Chionoecetes opilio]
MNSWLITFRCPLVRRRAHPLRLICNGRTLVPRDEVEGLGVTWRLQARGGVLYKTHVAALPWSTRAWVGGAAGQTKHWLTLTKVQGSRAVRAHQGQRAGRKPRLHRTSAPPRRSWAITVMYKVHQQRVPHLLHTRPGPAPTAYPGYHKGRCSAPAEPTTSPAAVLGTTSVQFVCVTSAGVGMLSLPAATPWRTTVAEFKEPCERMAAETPDLLCLPQGIFCPQTPYCVLSGLMRFQRGHYPARRLTASSAAYAHSARPLPVRCLTASSGLCAFSAATALQMAHRGPQRPYALFSAGPCFLRRLSGLCALSAATPPSDASLRPQHDLTRILRSPTVLLNHSTAATRRPMDYSTALWITQPSTPQC